MSGDLFPLLLFIERVIDQMKEQMNGVLRTITFLEKQSSNSSGGTGDNGDKIAQ